MRAKNPFRSLNFLRIVCVACTLFWSVCGAVVAGVQPEPASGDEKCPGPRTDAGARPKIVGGWQAGIAEWPGLVALRIHNPERNESGYICGGSMIAPGWVLTAAHCLHPWLRQDTGPYLTQFDYWKPFRDLGFSGDAALEVVFNVEDLARVGARQVRSVEQVIPHPHYDRANYFNDIALLRLSSAGEGGYTRLSLTSSTDPPTPPGATTMVAGFGVLEYLASLRRFPMGDGVVAAGSRELREVDLPTISTLDCRRRYGVDSINAGQICAGFDDEQKDSCQGDSGGQLVAFDRNGCPYQIGIVSWGEGCGEPRNYGVYTRVSHFAPWIRQHVPADLPAVDQADVPDWASASAKLLLVERNLDRLRELMGPVKDLKRLVLRRQSDGQVAMENRVQLDERYSIEIESPVDGRLILVDIDAVGNVTQIFPNKYVRSDSATLVKGGETVTLPNPAFDFDWFRASEPRGKGMLLALVVPTDFPLATWAASEDRLAKGLIPERSVASYLMNLTTQISKALGGRNLTPENAEKWSLQLRNYEIWE